MEIKSHLFEITQFCFLSSILLFLYLSVLLKPNFLHTKKKKKKKKEYLVFSCTVTKCERPQKPQDVCPAKDVKCGSVLERVISPPCLVPRLEGLVERKSKSHRDVGGVTEDLGGRPISRRSFQDNGDRVLVSPCSRG